MSVAYNKENSALTIKFEWLVVTPTAKKEACFEDDISSEKEVKIDIMSVRGEDEIIFNKHSQCAAWSMDGDFEAMSFQDKTSNVKDLVT